MHSPQEATFTDIMPRDVAAWRERGARIIDVREPFEFTQGHLPGAQLIPLNSIMARAAELTGPLVIVCASGSRSAAVAAYLARDADREVANLVGGTFGWRSQGMSLER